VQAADDDPVLVGVKQRKREALVAAGVLERVEADEADPLECVAALGLERRGSPGQPIDVRAQPPDLRQVGLEDRLEAPSVLAPGDAIEAAL
jgi:hypothetical protein